MSGNAGIYPVYQSLLSPSALLATLAADYARSAWTSQSCWSDRRAVPLFVVLRELWVVGQQARAAATMGHYLVTDPYLDARLGFPRSWEQHLATG